MCVCGRVCVRARALVVFVAIRHQICTSVNFLRLQVNSCTRFDSSAWNINYIWVARSVCRTCAHLIFSHSFSHIHVFAIAIAQSKYTLAKFVKALGVMIVNAIGNIADLWLMCESSHTPHSHSIVKFRTSQFIFFHCLSRLFFLYLWNSEWTFFIDQCGDSYYL